MSLPLCPRWRNKMHLFILFLYFQFILLLFFISSSICRVNQTGLGFLSAKSYFTASSYYFFCTFKYQFKKVFQIFHLFNLLYTSSNFLHVNIASYLLHSLQNNQQPHRLQFSGLFFCSQLQSRL